MTKKLFQLMVAFVAIVAFAACEKEPTPVGPEQPNQPEAPTSGELAAPVLRVENLEESSFTVAWDSVPGAVSYTVVLKGDVKQTTETSVSFTDMEVGEYTVRVKAIAPKGGELKDSGYATITVVVEGLTSVEWFDQTLFTDTDAEQGVYPYNALCVEWKGTGVKSIRYGLFETEELNKLSFTDVKKNLNTFSNELEILAGINGDGVSFYFTDLAGDTSYTLLALVTNEADVEFMARTEQKTEAAAASEDAQKWVGEWTVTSHETITFDSTGNATMGKKDESFKVTIKTTKISPDYVEIDGFSSYGAGWTTRGLVSGNTMYIMSGEIVGENEDNGYDYIWLAYCSVDGELGQFFNVSIPSYVLTMDASGKVSCEMFADTAEYSDGSKALVEVVHTDVYAQDPTSGDIYFLTESQKTFRAGKMEWSR